MRLPTTIRDVSDTQCLGRCHSQWSKVSSRLKELIPMCLLCWGLSPGVKASPSCYMDSSLQVALSWVVLSKLRRPKTGSVESRLVPFLSQASIFPHRVSPVPSPWRHTFLKGKVLLATAHMVISCPHTPFSEDMCVNLLQLPHRGLLPQVHMSARGLGRACSNRSVASYSSASDVS